MAESQSGSNLSQRDHDQVIRLEVVMGEVRSDIGEMKTSLHRVEDEVDDVKGEVQGLRGEFKTLKETLDNGGKPVPNGRLKFVKQYWGKIVLVLVFAFATGIIKIGLEIDMDKLNAALGAVAQSQGLPAP